MLSILKINVFKPTKKKKKRTKSLRNKQIMAGKDFKKFTPKEGSCLIAVQGLPKTTFVLGL